VIRGLAALGLACVLGLAPAAALGGAATILIQALDDAFRPGVVRVARGPP
jgi:hypothetical protein